jgi:hypothetical protein
MTLMWISNGLIPHFTLQKCVMFHSQKYTALIYTENVFCSSCTMTWVPSHHNRQCCSLCLATHRFTSLCHFSKQFATHRPTLHFLQKNCALRVCFFNIHTQQQLWFSLQGQYWECFTSNRLSWDENGLGLPLEILLAVRLSSYKWIINLRMRTSQEVLWVILPPYDLLIRNTLRMVMSVR